MIHTMHTVNGTMKLIYLKDFPSHVVRESVGCNFVNYATQKHTPDNFFSELTDITLSSLINHEIHLDKQVLISGQDLIKYRKGQKEFLIHSVQNKLILDDFKVMIAQKEPTLFLKDLSLHAIEELNNNLAMNGMTGDVLGIEVRLSEWQKFFVVCNIEDMKFYFNETRPIHMDGIQINGKLVNLKPHIMVMARYENLVYLNESNAMLRYAQIPNHRPDPSMTTIIKNPWDYGD